MKFETMEMLYTILIAIPMLVAISWAYLHADLVQRMREANKRTDTPITTYAEFYAYNQGFDKARQIEQRKIAEKASIILHEETLRKRRKEGETDYFKLRNSELEVQEKKEDENELVQQKGYERIEQAEWDLVNSNKIIQPKKTKKK